MQASGVFDFSFGGGNELVGVGCWPLGFDRLANVDDGVSFDGPGDDLLDLCGVGQFGTFVVAHFCLLDVMKSSIHVLWNW